MFPFKLGVKVESGVGPEDDLVAFSGLCPYMGCGLKFNAEQKSFECPCHFSIFNCESSGRMVIGQATYNLPRATLGYNHENGDIEATGVLGELYGCVSNVLPGGGCETMNSSQNYPIPQVSAKRTNLVCQHCLAGCGYHVCR
jgi:arsenite oxidase small subunit